MTEKLGVEVVGDAIGLKAALGESTVATNKWATETTGAAFKVEESFKGVTTAALRAQVAQDKLAMSVNRYGVGSLGAAQATVAYRKQVEALSASHLATAKAIGKGLTTYVTLPAAAAAGVAIKLGLDFESAMELIHTQAGASQEEVRQLSSAILGLAKSGQSFGQSATDMANGLYYVESEGIRGAKALEIVRVASAGAALGQTSLANTTNALTSAMKVYGLTADQAASAMATINAAVGAGKMHMEDLNAALATKFLPTAKQLGITLPQALAALDVFTRAGIPAESAATNLTTALIKFEAPTKAAAGALADLGLGSAELAGQLQSGGLPAALGLLAQRYEQVVKAQGKHAANTDILNAFGGSKGGSSVLTLVQQYASYMQGLQQVQNASSPATFWKDVSAEMNLPAEKIKRDVAEISAQAIELGTQLAPVAAEIVGDIAKVAAAFDRLPGPVKSDLGVIIAALAIGGPIIVGAASVVRAVRTIGTTFGMLPAQTGPALATVDGELAATGVAAEGAEAKVLSLRTALLGIAAIGVITVEIQVLESVKNKVLGLQKMAIAAEANAPQYGLAEIKHVASEIQQRQAQGQSPMVIANALYALLGGQGAGQEQLLAQAYDYLAGGKARQRVLDIFKKNAKPTTKVPTPTVPSKPQTLTPAQQMAIGLAANPNDVKLLQQKAAGDRSKIDALTKEFHEGKISAAGYTAKMIQLETDLHTTEQAISTATSKAAAASHKLAVAAESAARVAIANAKTQYQAAKANEDLAGEEAALQKEIQAYLDASRDKRIPAATRAQYRTDAATARAELSKMRNTFALPLSLQLAQAQATAGDYGMTSVADVAIASKIKKYDEMLLSTHALSIQGQIQIYEDIAQQNQILGNQALAGNTAAMSAVKMTAGLGLSRQQRIALEQRIAQAAAHGGRVPTGVGALGNTVYVNGDVHVHGVHDESTLLAQLQKKAKKRSTSRRGAHAGSKMGI